MSEGHIWERKYVLRHEVTNDALRASIEMMMYSEGVSEGHSHVHFKPLIRRIWNIKDRKYWTTVENTYVIYGMVNKIQNVPFRINMLRTIES